MIDTKNPIALVAKKLGDYGTARLFRDLNIADSLKTIELLILQCAKDGRWSLIYSKAPADAQSVKYLEYLEKLLPHLDKDQETQREFACTCVLNLMEQFCCRELVLTPIDHDCFSAFGKIFCFTLTKMKRDEASAKLWQKFLLLRQKLGEGAHDRLKDCVVKVVETHVAENHLWYLQNLPATSPHPQVWAKDRMRKVGTFLWNKATERVQYDDALLVRLAHHCSPILLEPRR